MCIVPMFVITARSGCAMRVSTDSSPKWFIPISSTAASQSGFSRRTLTGRPISLL